MKFYTTLQTGGHAFDVIHYSALEEAKLTYINSAILENMDMVSVNATRKLKKRFIATTKRVSNHTSSQRFKT